MTAARIPDGRQFLLGALLGVYGALVILVPDLTIRIALCAPLAALPLFLWLVGGATRWLWLFFLSALLLPPLPVEIGNSGPHGALLFAAAGLGIGVLRAREFRVPTDSLSVSLCGLLAILAGSVAMAAIYSGAGIAAASLARVGLFGISVFVFLYIHCGPGRAEMVNGFRLVRLLYWAAAGSALFACLDFYFQLPAPAGYGPQFIWLDSGVFRRAQGFFYEASTLGNVCAFFLEMIAVAAFRPRDKRPISFLAMLGGGAALAAALVLSYSRASLVNLGVALVVLFWMNRKRIRFGRLAIRAAVMGVAAAGIVAGAFPVFAQAYWVRIAASLPFFFEDPNAVLSGRLQSWQFLTDFLLSHPWHTLLGVGYKTLPYSDFIGATAVADNTYLSMLAETGIVGLAALLALNIAILRTAYRAAQATSPVRSFCGTWMFCFWTGQAVQMFSGDLLTYWRVLPVYFSVLALAAGDEVA